MRIEGIAVPYGVPVELGPGRREVFALGAFAADVAAWGARSDGARVPLVTSHPGDGSRAVIGVAELRDTPEGLRFTAELASTPAAAEYAELVRLGANGVSVEFSPVRSKRRDGGTLIEHIAARIHAIAGAVAPAYDTARVAVRSRRAMDMTEEQRIIEDDDGDEDAEVHVDEVAVKVTQERPDEEPEEPAPEDEPRSRSRITSIPGARAGLEAERRSRETSAVAKLSGSSGVRIDPLGAHLYPRR